MTNALLYLTVVLVWGSSWLLMKFQVGVVPPEASVIYRFAMAACLMFAWVILRRLPLRFTLRQHVLIAAQGALIFCTNFVLFYYATKYLTTGLVAVVMSTASIMTMLLNAVWLRQPPQTLVMLGAAMGACGIAVIFWPELAGLASGNGSALGLALSAAATLSFSAGAIIAGRNQAAGLSVRGTSAWAMFYGVALLTAFSLVRGIEFTFDPRFPYVASLMALTILSTIIAFACYFALLGRIGSDRAAYATVLFPVVALTLSTLFEGYQWTNMALIGVALTLAGNALVLMPRKPGRSAHDSSIEHGSRIA